MTIGEITLRKALDDFKIVYLTYRNFAEKIRVGYLNNLKDQGDVTLSVEYKNLPCGRLCG